MQKKWIFLFWLLAIADLISRAANISLIDECVKPLLMPALMAWLLTYNEKIIHRNLLLIALQFSWAGDGLLMFENHGALFFILGLAGFLLTHIFYIIYFLKIKSDAVSMIVKQPLLAMAVVGYSTGLVWLLFPHLKELKLPVLIYAVVIACMLLCSLHIFYKTNPGSRWYFVFGALLFVISDSLLAINKFYTAFRSADILIMLTYCSAQFLIISGALRRRQ